MSHCATRQIKKLVVLKAWDQLLKSSGRKLVEKTGIRELVLLL